MSKIVLLLSICVSVALGTPVEDLGSAGSVYSPFQTYSSAGSIYSPGGGSIISPGGGTIVSPGVSTVYSSQGIYRSGYGSAVPNHLGYQVGGYGLGYNVIPIAHGVEHRRTIGYYH
jgi:hypothetical protein